MGRSPLQKVSLDNYTPDVVNDGKIENDAKADVYIVEPYNLRSLLEEALDTLSYPLVYFQHCLLMEIILLNHCQLRMPKMLL